EELSAFVVELESAALEELVTLELELVESADVVEELSAFVVELESAALEELATLELELVEPAGVVEELSALVVEFSCSGNARELSEPEFESIVSAKIEVACDDKSTAVKTTVLKRIILFGLLFLEYFK
ncbi:hypothetical protein, partial [Liquorilactobacillus hordei]